LTLIQTNMSMVYTVKPHKLLIILVIVLMAAVLPGVQAQSDDDITVGLLLFNPLTFIDEMQNYGYIDGENISYMMLNFEGVAMEDFQAEYERQVQAMIDTPVDVFVVTNDTDAVNLRPLAGDIPIVFTISDDPVTTGAVADMIVPGGLTTGIVSNQHHTRRLQLLTEINPETDSIYYLYSAFAIEGEAVLAQVSALGEALGVEVIPAPVADAASGIEVLQTVPEGADWLFLTPFLPFDLEFADALVNASMSNQVPIAGFLAAPTPGYAVIFGPDLDLITRQSAGIVDQILRGANPGDLPVAIAENILIVNVEVAASLNMEFPDPILRQANQIIRPGDLDNFVSPGT